MVQMNLFAKQRRRHRPRMDMQTPRGMCGDGVDWETGNDLYTLLCMGRAASESRCTAQGTVLTALWRPNQEGNQERGICVCIWLICFAIQQKLAQCRKATRP